MKLDRLFAIVMLIVNRKRVSAEELARYFEVSVRTIYRDIDAINLAGIPIVAYPGKNGGFGIMESFKFDRHVLTPDEIFSIVTALKGVGASVAGKRARDTAEKLTTLLPPDERTRLKKREETIIIDSSPWMYPAHLKKRADEILRAIEECRVVGMSYVDGRGTTAKRAVEPMTLVLKGTVWYFFGYCRLRGDFRVFRISRIKSLRVTGERFARRPMEYSPEQWTDNWTSKPPLDLVLRFKPRARVRVEDYFLPAQVRRRKDGGFDVRTRYPEDEWVYGFLLSFGEDVEVLEPRRIRDLVRARAEKIHAIYEKDVD
ncbi:MAG: YafY family transcriptional regulator [Spirochaetes bacterium]|nr:MAG: YafY family transcriptional regulator [Spirochaetota bacterium]